MSGRLLVVGSVNHDLVVAVERLPAPGETVLGAELVERDGGKGANAAAAAARLGASVAMVGATGADARGDRARAALAEAGVDVALVARLEHAPTGVAVVAVDSAGENQIVVAPGANAAVTAAQVEAALAARAGSADAVLVSCEVPDEAVAAAVRGAHERGLRCVLNPAPARPSLLELAPWAPLLTPNRAEAARLAGEDDPEAAAVALAARTGAPVVVTLGDAGALLVTAGEAPSQHFPARAVAVRDTTGAGDAFNGALGARLALGDALADAVAYAVAAAGWAVATLGARAPLDPSEVERALDAA
jgi:ribokinase